MTNSSSSAYICLHVDRDMEDLLLRENGMSYESIEKRWEEEWMDDIPLKGHNIRAVIGDGGYIHYVGRDIGETDLEEKTLLQLRQDLSDTILKEYGIRIPPEKLIFEFGEISRG